MANRKSVANAKVSVTFRIDVDLYNKIAELADKDDRSMNSMAAIMLRAYTGGAQATAPVQKAKPKTKAQLKAELDEYSIPDDFNSLPEYEQNDIMHKWKDLLVSHGATVRDDYSTGGCVRFFVEYKHHSDWCETPHELQSFQMWKMGEREATQGTVDMNWGDDAQG